jgi:recombination endonuclease VII
VKLTRRDKYLRAKYGITEAIYNKMLLHGKGACWICKRKPSPGTNLNVDHEHLTKDQKKAGIKFGKVRGLLDFFCNKYLIGRRKAEHAHLFTNAAEYLRSEKDWGKAD